MSLNSGHDDHQAPVFYASTRRRWKLFKRALLLGSILGTAAIAIVTASVLRKGDLPQPPVIGTIAERTSGPGQPVPAKKAAEAQPRNLPCCGQLRAGFYVNWDKNSWDSLAKNLDQMNVVFPEWLFLTAIPGGLKTDVDAKALKVLHDTGKMILPMVSNALGSGWPTAAMLTMVRDQKLRSAFIQSLLDVVRDNDLDGLNLDFENTDAEGEKAILVFQKELYQALHAQGFSLTRDVEANTTLYNLPEVAANADYLVLMAYDEHYSEGKPGPIASPAFVQKVLTTFTAAIPAKKIIMGLPAYGYDWPSTGTAESVSFVEAMTTAKQHRATISFDTESSHIRYHYSDQAGKQRTVWLADAATDFNLLRLTEGLGLAGTAVWRLGSEDPRLWNFFKGVLPSPSDKARSVPNLEEILGKTEAEITGDGDILEMTRDRDDGSVVVAWDKTNQRIRGENYLRLPAPMSFVRSGSVNKTVALTFDDGPDPTYTPQVLAILEREHVPATFFLIGNSAAHNPDLVRRIYAGGHEIGNHSLTHPEFHKIGPLRMQVELRSTERIVEAITGHSTLLFRPPYGGDGDGDEPNAPVYLAAAGREGMLAVMDGIDPRDWEPTASVDSILGAARSRPGSVLLLHDAGGDRSVTVAALPSLIDYYRKAGYRFTTVSGLVGKQRIDVMPPLRSVLDNALALCNGAMLWLVNRAESSLFWLFSTGICLMLLRSTALLVMAKLQIRRKQKVATATTTLDRQPLVSVIIPAFNERLNAVAAIRHVLASRYTNIEVIFVDDGSTDSTYAEVEAACNGNQRLRLVRKVNGGKASAINSGLIEARGEFVVCIDADTRIDAQAIEHLLCAFADPTVAAVAGHVSIANQVNLLTRLQNLEYVTAQAVDRQAFELVNGVITIPGALGAFRRTVIREAGGFTSDTLAEDSDLTIRILKLGYQVAYCPSARAMTEAPESATMFLRQRFRWTFGIMQCLWKHRQSIFSKQNPGLSWVALPYTMLYQFILPTLAPLGDLCLILALTSMDASPTLWYALAFLVIDALTTSIALVMAKERMPLPRLLTLLFARCFVYRYLLYVPLCRAILAAMRGQMVGWGHLKRHGRVASVPFGATQAATDINGSAVVRA